jgi:phage terminase large subunit-like protein
VVQHHRVEVGEGLAEQLRDVDKVLLGFPAIRASLELLRGRPCFGGLDLSATTDVTALAWVFPPEQDDGLWHVLSRYFVPEENLRKRAERDRVPYDLWTRQGFIEATSGNVVDYSAIEQRILADSALFQVKEIAYDPWNATHIALRLQDEGAAMVEFRQGFRSMAAPTRELEKLIVSRKLAHGGNPVTRWMAANVAVAQDPAGNLKPAKDKSTERIDGIVATIMAIGRAMVVQEQPQPPYQMIWV